MTELPAFTVWPVDRPAPWFRGRSGAHFKIGFAAGYAAAVATVALLWWYA